MILMNTFCDENLFRLILEMHIKIQIQIRYLKFLPIATHY